MLMILIVLLQLTVLLQKKNVLRRYLMDLHQRQELYVRIKILLNLLPVLVASMGLNSIVMKAMQIQIIYPIIIPAEQEE